MVRTVMMCHGIFFMVTRIMLILTSSLAIAVAGHRHALVFFLLPAISATIFIATSSSSRLHQISSRHFRQNISPLFAISFFLPLFFCPSHVRHNIYLPANFATQFNACTLTLT